MVSHVSGLGTVGLPGKLLVVQHQGTVDWCHLQRLFLKLRMKVFRIIKHHSISILSFVFSAWCILLITLYHMVSRQKKAEESTLLALFTETVCRFCNTIFSLYIWLCTQELCITEKIYLSRIFFLLWKTYLHNSNITI